MTEAVQDWAGLTSANVQVLALLRHHDGSTTGEILSHIEREVNAPAAQHGSDEAMRSLRGLLNGEASGMRQRLRKMMALGLVHSTRTDANHSSAVFWHLTVKGRRWLTSAENAASGNYAQPRAPVSTDPYDGRELRPFAGRPGALAAYALPTFDNGTRLPRARPMSLGAKPTQEKRGR